MEELFKPFFFSEYNIQQTKQHLSNNHLKTEYTEMLIGTPKLNVLVAVVFLQVSISLGKKTTKQKRYKTKLLRSRDFQFHHNLFSQKIALKIEKFRKLKVYSL